MEDNKENVESVNEDKKSFYMKEYMKGYSKKYYMKDPSGAKRKRNFYSLRTKYDIKDYDKWYAKYKYELYNIVKLIELKNDMSQGTFEQMLMDLRDFEFVKKP